MSNAELSSERDSRFASGWRLLHPNAPIPPAVEPDLVFDVVRPRDLVSISVAAYEAELVEGESPVLRATGDAALVISFSYQHLGEQAFYEGQAPIPDPMDPSGEPLEGPTGAEEATLQPPIQALPSRSSRLVFSLEDGDEIPFSTEGILGAMRRLPLVVHPRALPRSGVTPVPPVGPMIHIDENIVAIPRSGTVVFTPTTRRTAPPELGVGDRLSVRARNLRRIRDALTYSSGIAVRLEEPLVDDIVSGPRIVRPDHPIRIRNRPQLSRPTEALETMIEAPFRLEISPSSRGGFTHADTPVPAEDAEHRVELWHSRLGVRTEDDDGVAVDERSSDQRIIRAVWARDREAMGDWENLRVAGHSDAPFRMSLDSADRHMLVRQSAESWLGSEGSSIRPEPVDVNSLWLSALGAWLDLHGEWDTLPYTSGADPMSAVLSWDHVAPMGRDQYVRVTYPGYLFPFGHRATLVKLTERKLKQISPSVAALYQRKFLVVGEPVRFYEQDDLPFTQVRLAPLITPTLSPDPGPAQDSFFFPMVGGQRFRFILHCVDREGRRVRLLAPLLWVADHFRPLGDVADFYETEPGRARDVSALGQDIAYAPTVKGGDTMLPTSELHLGGTALEGTSRPRLDGADVVIPTIERLSPVGTLPISYADTYIANGFGGSANAGDVWAKVTRSPVPELVFGAAGAGSDKAGGFLQPNLKIDGLSRLKGVVGDVASTATAGFNPSAFLAELELPQLFGIVPLVDLLEALGVDLDDAPSIVSDALERIDYFISELERVKLAAEDAVANAQRMVDQAAGKAAEVVAEAQQALNDAQALRNDVTDAVNNILAQLEALPNATKEVIETALDNPLQALTDAIDDIEQLAPRLPPLIRNKLLSIASTLRSIADAADLFEELFNFLNGFAGGSLETSFRFEWTPVLKSWRDENNPILELKTDSLELAVEGRASANDGMSVAALAELHDFTLNLLPGAELVRFKFDHLSFSAGSQGKPDVDVVLNDIEFVGILAFVEILKDLIPFDGFSDPPYLDVKPEGLTAGFTLGLPNVAVGVFNLSNISLGADVEVPFLGKAVTVGFNFCTRDRPFTLAVLFIGGGGWFSLRISPDGLDALELGLEAGAMLAVDFGVASGSISAMIGIYMRLEADEGSLAGYFRLRGEVDVLGLISASIELYLELLYEFATGKMVGRASLTIEVEVLFFSASVTIEAERRFAGSNGDPNFRDVMGLESDGTSPAWSEYCLAFAGA